jgi:ComF family protein
LRELIHFYKYQGKEYLADYFVDMCLRRWGLSSSSFEAVVGVPLSFWRSLQRGFNPPGVVAEKLARKWRVPVLKNVLKRRSGFPSQTHLGKVERRMNASRSFYLHHRTNRVKGGQILLIDDVLTTGATLSVCAKLLREVGFDKVVGATIAYDPLLPNKTVSATIRGII